MNFFQELITSLQNLVGQVPEVIQPLILVLAGAIPTIEGDVAAMIGIVSGINPILAGISAAAGNFLSVLVIVFVTSGARSAIANRRVQIDTDTATTITLDAPKSGKPESESRKKGREKFKKYFDRYGVPGASIFGPLALPSQVTSAILVASGSSRAGVLFWHAVSIAIWTTVASASSWMALKVVFLV